MRVAVGADAHASVRADDAHDRSAGARDEEGFFRAVGEVRDVHLWLPHPSPALWGAVAGYVSLWLVYKGFKLLTGKEGMGYGDFKLLAALGAWLGVEYLLAIVLLSSVVGAVIGVFLLMALAGWRAWHRLAAQVVR